MSGRSVVPDGCPLTRRQFEVLQLLGQGLTGKQVADELGIAARTVRGRTLAALKALGCDNPVQAANLMGRRGWLNWEPPEEVTPLAVEHPFLAAYLQEFERSRWPHEPDDRSARRMRLALAGHRTTADLAKH